MAAAVGVTELALGGAGRLPSDPDRPAIVGAAGLDAVDRRGGGSGGRSS